MPRFRLRAAPGNSGTVSGTLRRREGSDFRLAAALDGMEWELPTVKHLMARCEALLSPWQQCEVTLSVTWRETASHPVPLWRVKRRSPSKPLTADAAQEPLRFNRDD